MNVTLRHRVLVSFYPYLDEKLLLNSVSENSYIEIQDFTLNLLLLVALLLPKEEKVLFSLGVVEKSILFTTLTVEVKLFPRFFLVRQA